MSEPNAILTQVLTSDRPIKQRLSLLETIRDELKDDASIQALLAAAREEKTLELRSAFLAIALKIDVTRITDRERYICAILHFSVAEEDVSLRRSAIVRLSKIAADDPRIQEMLIETLCCDLDASVQSACIDAMANIVNKSTATIKRLLEFARISPLALRKDLIKQFSQLQSEDAQAGISIFLHTSEDAAVRRLALTKLGELPKLEPAVSALIVKMASSDPSEELQQQAARVLRDSKQIDPELFKSVFALLARFPERTDLLEAVRHRLASFPELLKTLPELFVSVKSAQLRMRILELLKDAPLVPLFVKALSDPKWQVRRTAIEICKLRYADKPDEIGLAFAECAKVESIVVVRESIARAFPERSRRSSAVDRALIEWFENESEPRVQAALILSLRAIPANGEHRASLFRAYRKILAEPFCDDALRGILLNELGNLHIETDAGFADDLKAQLRRCGSVEEMETLYARLRTAEPDPGGHADLQLQLFYRFIGDFPREPLSQWLTDFQNLSAHDANIRREIPYIVKLTGASWILGAAEPDAQKSALLSALLEQIRLGRTIEAVRLLEEAFTNRTIRKSDIIALFKSLLPLQHNENVMNRVMVLMQRGGLMPLEIFEIGFAYLRENPRNGVYTSMMCDFLQGRDQDHTPLRSINERRPDLATPRKQDPNYRTFVFDAFSQNELLNYWGDLPEELDKPFEAKDTNDWEYQKWGAVAEDWPIAKMFYELKPYEKIVEILSLPVSPEVSSSRTLQFLLLKKLWTEPEARFPDQNALFHAIGTLFRNTRSSDSHRLLNDRAVLVLSMLWDRRISRQSGLPKISPELSRMAAEIYAAVCQRQAGFYGSEKKFPEVYPDILVGLNVEHLKSIWPFGADLWSAISKARLDSLPQEMKARELHSTILAVEDEGRFEECYALYGELLKLGETSYVKTHYSILSFRQEDYDPAKLPTDDNQKAAQFQYESIMEKVGSNAKPSQITHAIGYAFSKLWKTKVLTERRAELIALRNKLRTVSEE